ncbi:ribonuclease 3-like protein 2 [Camellia sinensis]|uniref:ribonuclease 3-like protein 2 n=1 Tax=Camellia sinensis TaxID=4442 RepID=UPI001035D9AE|nr:ribonuclease 3-like protein 2 [Camellia sinensis]
MELLNYQFNDKKLLEEAQTHPSYTDSPSYQRLEFVGDAALGIAISNFFFLAYPDLLTGQLSLLRSANVSTEKLARAAVRHGLYKYVRRNTAALDEKIVDIVRIYVRDFTLAVRPEADTVVYGGTVKAPKVLADIVESVAAAVYVDCQFDLQAFWVVRGSQQRQPVTMLFEFCQKEGKQVNIKYRRRRKKNIARVYVDGKFIASSSCEQKENAKFQAAKAASEKLSHSNGEDKMNVDIYISMNGTNEIEGAKQKLHEICGKKRWPKPTYQ